MDTAFDAEKFDLAYSAGVENHYWTLTRNKILFHQIRKRCRHNDAILEIGCGRGIVVDYLNKQGLNCTGIELAPVPVGDGINIISSADALEMPQSFAQRFKVILLLDVIEHIENPKQFIMQIFSHYSNAEVMIVTVPARSELWSNYDTFYGHFRRYDLKMLSQTINASGLKVVFISYFFHALFWPAKIMLKLTGKRSVKMNPPSPLAGMAHRFIAACLFAEYRMCPPKWFGSSIIGVAERSKN